jgi:hypothetical protein
MPQTIRSEGRIIIPAEEFNNFVLAKLNEPAGTFVALSEPKVTNNGSQIEVLFSTATDFQPGPPVWPPTA